MLSIMEEQKTSLQRLFPVYFHVSPLGTKHNGEGKRYFKD